MIITILRKIISTYRRNRNNLYNKIIQTKILGQKGSIGKNTKFMGGLIQISGEIHIGDNCIIRNGNGSNPLSRNIQGCLFANSGATIKIGNHVGISSCAIWAHESISIGDYTLIGADTIILDSDAHSLDWETRRTSLDQVNTSIGGGKNSKPILIGHDVLIGTRCIILKGVHIGDRSIIGSGSVVTKDIPSDCIAAGNPCQVIRKI